MVNWRRGEPNCILATISRSAKLTTALHPKSETLLKYLCDSLRHSEQSFGDALYPIPTHNKDRSFIGEREEVQPVTPQECRVLMGSVSRAVTEMKHENGKLAQRMDAMMTQLSFAQSNPHAALPPCIQSKLVPSAPIPMVFAPQQWPPTVPVQQQPMQGEALVPAQLAQCPRLKVATSRLLPPTTNPHQPRKARVASVNLAIPDLRATSKGKPMWRQAVDQWLHPDPVTGLPLKDWPQEWFQGPMRLQLGVKYGEREVIGNEFVRWVPLGFPTSYSPF